MGEDPDPALRDNNQSKGFIWIYRDIYSNAFSLNVRTNYNDFVSSGCDYHEFSGVFSSHTLGEYEPWLHLGVTIDYNNREYKIYKNGVIVSTHTTPYDITFASFTGQCCIGALDYGLGTVPWYGSMDDLALFNRKIEPNEMREIASGGRSSKGIKE